MGIFVPEATLTNGVTVSNVYMSFSQEHVYVNCNNNELTIQSYYKVFKDRSYIPDSVIRIPIKITSNDPNSGVYTLLYEALKQVYPNSTDVLD